MIIDNKEYALTGSQIEDLAERIKENASGVVSNSGEITTINEKIPAQATAQNQLADKDFVNSSVATNTANFVGTFNTIEELEAVQNPTNNDYGFVIGTDQAGNTVYNRYKFNGSAWAFEYALNNSSFTADQWAAIQSGITAGLVTKLSNIPADAEANTIDSISVNGVAQTPDANKNVDLTIEGGVKTLTADDYNYPTTGTKTEIALWLLQPGIYKIAEGVAYEIVFNSGIITAENDFVAINSKTNFKSILALPKGLQGTLVYVNSSGQRINSDNFSSKTVIQLLTRADIANSLGSTSTVDPLSANQGRILNNNIGNLTTLTTTAKTSAVAAINELDSELDNTKPLSGSAAPTTSTEGTLGQTYIDTSTGDIYYLSEIDETTSPSTYTWEKIATGSGVNVVQTTGTSTTDVMSQNATSSLVYLDPSEKVQIRIGNGAQSNGIYAIGIGRSARGNCWGAIAIGDGATTANNGLSVGHSIAIGESTLANGGYATALGYDSEAQGRGSIAIGAFSHVANVSSNQGVIQVGLNAASSAEQSSYGYNGSAYRLLRGLYDPQSDNDAATKGYVDSLIASLEARIAALEGN